MENQNQNQNQTQTESRSIKLCLVIIFLIYTIIHCIIFLIRLLSGENFRDIRKSDYAILLILFGLFISFLLTGIFVIVYYRKNSSCILYICLIPSIINELIFIGILIVVFYTINNTGSSDDDELIIFLSILVFLIESIPNILLIFHICKKSRNKNSQNIDNINNNSLLLFNMN